MSELRWRAAMLIFGIAFGVGFGMKIVPPCKATMIADVSDCGDEDEDDDEDAEVAVR